jgi:hypothetical protein
MEADIAVWCAVSPWHHEQHINSCSHPVEQLGIFHLATSAAVYVVPELRVELAMTSA